MSFNLNSNRREIRIRKRRYVHKEFYISELVYVDVLNVVKIPNPWFLDLNIVEGVQKHNTG